MFTLINSQSLWIGTDLKRFNQIKDALVQADIPYKQVVKNQLGEWTGAGTVRGRMGSLGNSEAQMYQYEILVYKKDMERARHFIKENHS